MEPSSPIIFWLPSAGWKAADRDPRTGQWLPWPWTVNAEGQDMYFATQPEAIAAVERLQGQGVRSIDVGCMQVNLMYHPRAFATLEQAFDPQANADYAALFLIQLFQQTGSWPKAGAMYHSANPDIAADYARRLAAVWPDENRREEARVAPLLPGWSSLAAVHATGTRPVTILLTSRLRTNLLLIPLNPAR